MPKLKKLNLGCGSNKIEGFINIDIEPSTKPDLVCNFITDKLPYKDNSIDEVVLYHTIEHISKRYHNKILLEIWRVLNPKGLFYLSYPEFTKCYKNWIINYKGKREFWEATIYGRQLYPSDFHVCIMHTNSFKEVLIDCGFNKIIEAPEIGETYNTIIQCSKGPKSPKYEDLMKNYMNNFKLIKNKTE